MISLRFDTLASIVNGTLTHTDVMSRTFTGVSIDSRTIKSGELFIALRGANTDGHSYLAEAANKGAAGVVVDLDPEGVKGIPGGCAIITVDDTHRAMIDLAKHYRNEVDPTIVGITGSNGKTTTKELTYQVVSACRDNIYCSPGNLNNLYGLPLALFQMPETTEVAILEMGISTPGEMARLADIAQVDIAVMLNVGPSHLKFLNSVEDVARAKLEMVTAAENTPRVIINADSANFVAEAKRAGLEYSSFGIDADADIRPTSITTTDDGDTEVVWAGNTFRLALPGNHQVYNLLAAIAVARELGCTFDRVNTREIELSTVALRGQIVEKNGVRFLADCYNANPESVKAGLKAFFGAPCNGRRIVVLGDMLELGKDEARYHQEIGYELASYSFNQAFFVGPLSNHIQFGAINKGVEEAKCRHFKNSQALAQFADRLFETGDFIYLKASRGIGLEVVLDAFVKKEEAA